MPLEGQYVTDRFDRDRHLHLWGNEEWIVNNERYCGKILHINPGVYSSLHFHPVKDETFMCVEGLIGLAVVRGLYATVHIMRGWARDVVDLPHNTPHRFWAIDGTAEVVEFSSRHDDADVVRLDESRQITEEEMNVLREIDQFETVYANISGPTAMCGVGVQDDWDGV